MVVIVMVIVIVPVEKMAGDPIGQLWIVALFTETMLIWLIKEELQSGLLYGQRQCGQF